MADEGGDKKKRTLRGDLQRLGHFLGLYPDDEHGKHVIQPKTPAAPKASSCTTPGCEISEKHAHGPLRYEYSFEDDDAPMHTPGPTHPANRAHFDKGSAEHLPEGVVSLNAYKEAKAAKRPPGY
jgi:hypothetical protein